MKLISCRLPEGARRDDRPRIQTLETIIDKAKYEFWNETMKWPRFRIRTFMIVVALMAVLLALIMIAWRWLFVDMHLHDFYFTFGLGR